jgi:hypothetical protein
VAREIPSLPMRYGMCPRIAFLFCRSIKWHTQVDQMIDVQENEEYVDCKGSN